MPSITGKYLNQNKREAEAMVVTLPSMLNEGGGRTNSAPEYVQGGTAYTASVVPKESITGKTYLVVEEAFPATTTITATLAGVTIFSAVSVATTGITVSSVEDELLLSGGDVEITLSGSGDLVTGKLQIVTNYTPYTVMNGRYTVTPA